MQKPATQLGVLSDEMARVAGAYVETLKYCWDRGTAINKSYFDKLVHSAAGAYTGAETGENAIAQPLRHVAGYATEIAMLPWLAARTGADALAREPVTGPDMYFIAERDGWFDLAGKDEGSPVLLPVRVRNASQFRMVFAVDKTDAQAVLNDRGLPFTAIDCGRDETALVLFGIKYKDGDLGTYDELGVALYVTRNARPCAAPGMYILDLPVNRDFARAAGKIWGLPKTTEDLSFNIEGKQAVFKFARRNSPDTLLTLQMPRAGGSSSMAMPVDVYTMKNGTPHHFIMLGTGSGQFNQAGGEDILVTLGSEQFHVNDPLWKFLDNCGIAGDPPIHYQWSENVTIEIGAPRRAV
ncbi:MAG: acetoacetate decarboxylase family protein [Gammaproteobacteria bacterium]